MKRREGFTLAELLIVVVIIGILVSISIPIFTAQMHKAKVAADWANLRAYYAEIQALPSSRIRRLNFIGI